MRKALPVILLCIAATVAGGAAANNPELDKRREQLRKGMEQQWRNLTELPGPRRISDLFKVRFDGGRVVLLTDIQPAAGRNVVKVRIEGRDGWCIVNIQGNARKDQPPLIFSLSITDFSDPDAAQVNINLSYHMGTLAVSRYHQVLNGYRNISFTWGANVVDGSGVMGTGVQLVVNMGDNAAPARLNVQRTAPDLMTLRRNYPRDVNQYLRPLLRELGMESLLAADLATAYHVFAADLKPDPAVQDKLARLLPALDDDSYAKQQDALKQIGQLGLAGAVAIAHLDRSRLSAQQNVLLDAAVAAFVPAQAAPRAMKSDLDFVLDCLYLTDPTICAAALREFQRMTGRPVDFDLSAQAEQRAAAVDRLRAELHGKQKTPDGTGN